MIFLSFNDVVGNPILDNLLCNTHKVAPEITDIFSFRIQCLLK